MSLCWPNIRDRCTWPFLDYLNSKHPNIKFTHECEQDNKLSFLDITISRSNNKFHTSTYRKPTFTGLGTSFFSFVPLKFKTAALQTLIHRAYNICSDYFKIHTELVFLKTFFKNNGYPQYIIDRYIKKFLNSIKKDKITIFDVPKKVMYITLPFFGHQSEKLKKELDKSLSNLYPYINFNFILTNTSKIGSFFNYKDRLPKSMLASVIYQFSCARSGASVSYVGSTKRHLYQRVAEHAGLSARSNKPVTSPLHSNIRLHSNTCNCSITLDMFKILGSTQKESDLHILESLHIHQSRPTLNDQLTASPLLIL